MPDVRRLLDANANRAREAMRVMEDAARFLLDDAKLSADLKQLRHDFAGCVKVLSRFARGLELHRDTPGDVGTRIGTESEKRRRSTRDVVTAAAKRLTEALRCLEEYGKLYCPITAERLEQLRYRAYTLEKRLHEELGASGARQWKLCVVLTESLCTHHKWLDVAKASLDAGADCLQLREKNLTDKQLLDRAVQLCDLVYQYGAKKHARLYPSVIVNDRPDIAWAAFADGLHLGEHDLPVARTRQIVGPDLCIGFSTHNLKEAAAAIQEGADYCGVGAVFPTTTKQRKPSGLKYLKQFLAKYPDQPHLAIGGITPDNVRQVADAGAQGVAVSSAVCAANKPGVVAGKLLKNF